MKLPKIKNDTEFRKVFLNTYLPEIAVMAPGTEYVLIDDVDILPSIYRHIIPGLEITESMYGEYIKPGNVFDSAIERIRICLGLLSAQQLVMINDHTPTITTFINPETKTGTIVVEFRYLIINKGQAISVQKCCPWDER